jgi:hypothetical protein
LTGFVIRRSARPPVTAIIRADMTAGTARLAALGRLLAAPARAMATRRRTRGTRAAS